MEVGEPSYSGKYTAGLDENAYACFSAQPCLLVLHSTC